MHPSLSDSNSHVVGQSLRSHFLLKATSLWVTLTLTGAGLRAACPEDTLHPRVGLYCEGAEGAFLPMDTEVVWFEAG